MSQIKNKFLAQMATLTIKGNNTGGNHNPIDLTVAQVNAILPVFTSTLNGLAPLSGGGSVNFLRADGTWAAPPGATSGTVTSVALTVPSFLSISGSPITSSGTLAVTLSGSALPVSSGGTGDTSFTAYSVITGGTTTTGPLQSVVSVGTTGQVLTSNGAGALPTWQPNSSAITNNYFSGTMSSASNWNTTSSAFADGSNSGGNALTGIYSNGISVSAAASSLAGITFTPATSTSVYKITANVCTYSSGFSTSIALRLTDGTTAFAWSGASSGSADQTTGTQVLTGVYAPGTGSAVTVKVQLLTTGSGSAYIYTGAYGADIPVIQWSVEQIK